MSSEDSILLTGGDPAAFFGEKGGFYHTKLAGMLMHAHRYVVPMDSDPRREIYVYEEDNGLYSTKGASHIRRAVNLALRHRYTEWRASSVRNFITSSSSVLVSREYITQPNPYLLPCENLILDIDTLETRDYSPDYFFLSKINTRYDLLAECPSFLEFLDSIELTHDNIALLQEFWGYMLSAEARYKLALMLYGPRDTGKTTLIDVLKRFLGEFQYGTIPLHEICSGKWYAAELQGKRLNACAEARATDLVDTRVFKLLTGAEESIHAERKYRDPYKYKPFVKLAFGNNRIPYCPDQDLAFYERWGLIELHKQFRRGDPARDEKLLSKLTTPEELSGILNWALEGYRRLIDNSGFTTLGPVEDRKHLWQNDSSTLYAFIYSDRVVKDHEGFYPTEEFSNDCAQFAVDNDKAVWTKDLIGKRIRTFPFIRKRHIVDPWGDRVYAWFGIKRAD